MRKIDDILKDEFLKDRYSQKAKKRGISLEKLIQEENEEELRREQIRKAGEERIIKYKCKDCSIEWEGKGKDEMSKHGGWWEADRILSIQLPIISTCKKCYVSKKFNSLIPPKFHYLAVIPEREELLNKNWNKNLFITGTVGTGKTVFTCAVGKKRLEDRQEFKFLNYASFIMKLQSMFGKDGENAYDRAEEIAEYKGLLIIDDLGAEKLTDFVRQITYFLINEREQYERDTIITSNFSLGEIDAQIDKRISSRIVGMCEVLKFKGKDRRLNK